MDLLTEGTVVSPLTGRSGANRQQGVEFRARGLGHRVVTETGTGKAAERERGTERGKEQRANPDRLRDVWTAVDMHSCPFDVGNPQDMSCYTRLSI